jgi:hypothetical protein
MEALTGKRPRMYRRSGYKIMIACCGEHPGVHALYRAV